VESLKSVFGKGSDYLTDLLKILENVHFNRLVFRRPVYDPQGGL